MKIIGITGYALSGKDCLFRLLSRRVHDGTGYHRFAFADELKKDLQPFVLQHFGFDLLTCTPAQKQSVRQLMIGYGCSWRAVDPEHWIRRLDEKIKTAFAAASLKFTPVITDIRFENEVLYFKEKLGDNFKLIEVSRTDSGLIPPAEEQVQFPKVQRHVDYVIQWPTVGEECLHELRPYVDSCYNNMIRKML